MRRGLCYSRWYAPAAHPACAWAHISSSPHSSLRVCRVQQPIVQSIYVSLIDEYSPVSQAEVLASASRSRRASSGVRQSTISKGGKEDS